MKTNIAEVRAELAEAEIPASDVREWTTERLVAAHEYLLAAMRSLTLESSRPTSAKRNLGRALADIEWMLGL